MDYDGRMGRGWRLACQSWNVIESDRTLLALPLLSALSTLLAGAAIFGPGVYYSYHDDSHVPVIVAAAAGAYPMSFISAFFGVAFLSVARRRLAGEQAGVRDGLAAARERLGAIAAWALVNTLFGLLLRVLQQLPGGDHVVRLVGLLLAIVLQIAWSLASFFVLPVIALDGVGPREAMRRSLATFRKQWGESITGGFVVGASFAILSLPIFIVGAIGVAVFLHHPAAGAIVIAVAVGLFLLWFAAEAAVSQLFSLALFEFANGRKPVGPFRQYELDNAFVERRSLRNRLRRRRA